MSTSSITDNKAPLFSAFEWVGARDQVDTGRYTMLSNIRDLASGVALALQLVERSALQKDLDDAPIIDGAAAVRFTRMSIAAMNVIEGYIDEHFDEMSEQGMDRRQAEKQGEPAR
jgi:hypothetical protein